MASALDDTLTQQLFLYAAYRGGLLVAYETVGLSRQACTRYRNTRPEFAARVKDALALRKRTHTDEDLAEILGPPPEDVPPPEPEPPPPPPPPKPPPPAVIDAEIVLGQSISVTRDQLESIAPREGPTEDEFRAALWRGMEDRGESAIVRVQYAQTLAKFFLADKKRESAMLVAEAMTSGPAQTDGPRGLPAIAQDTVLRAVAGPPARACPVCSRQVFEATDGTLSPHWPHPNPACESYAREAHSSGLDGLCPGDAHSAE